MINSFEKGMDAMNAFVRHLALVAATAVIPPIMHCGGNSSDVSLNDDGNSSEVSYAVRGTLYEEAGQKPAGRAIAVIRSRDFVPKIISDLKITNLPSDSFIRSAVTDSAGRFVFDSIPAGTYVIEGSNEKNDCALIDSVAVDSSLLNNRILQVPQATLKPPSIIQGAFEPAGGASGKKLVFALGLDKFDTLDAFGRFSLAGLPEGRLRLQFISMLGGSLSDSSMSIKTEAGKTTYIGASDVVADIDGNRYATVTIGNQVWLAENLKTTKYNDGAPIPLITDDSVWSMLATPGYCWYENNETAYKSVYGALYNWHAVNTGKLAPRGWHIPTDAEWDTLVHYLLIHGYSLDGTATDSAIGKSLAANSNWAITTNGRSIGNDLSQNNSSGFSALPAGGRSNIDFQVISSTHYYNITIEGFWWSSTEIDASNAWYRSLSSYTVALLYRYSYPKSYGFSVRCIKD